MSKVRVAIAGIGSCASSLVQLVEMSKDKSTENFGIMFNSIGQYGPGDIDFVCAFDVDDRKIGKDLSEAIFDEPNRAKKHFNVPNLDVPVVAGPLLDGIEGNLKRIITPHPLTVKVSIQEVSQRLKETNADVLVCYLPTGSFEAVRAYASAAIEAKVAFVNGTPEPVANDPYFAEKFTEAETPLIGDDIRSHLGATTLHTALIELLHSRGLHVDNTYQLNFGGNSDFLNLSSPTRSASKQKSKRNALNAAGIDASTVAAGPNGYVEYLGDNKVCYLRLEASSVLHSPLSLEIRLEVEDSPNSAGVIISAVRAAKIAKDLKLSGVIDEVCPLFFKSPRKGATESEALELFNKFLNASILKHS